MFFCLSGLGLDLGAAFWAGDDDLALAHRHPADGLAIFAGEVFVVLVGVALPGAGVFAPHPPPPVNPFLVLLPPLIEVLGEHAKEDQHHQRPKGGPYG